MDDVGIVGEGQEHVQVAGQEGGGEGVGGMGVVTTGATGDP